MGQCLGYIPNLYIHQFHSLVLPFGLESRPSIGQRTSLEYCQKHGAPDGVGMESRYHTRHLHWLLASVYTICRRYDNTLVAYALETMVPHQLRTTAIACDGNISGCGGFHRLSIHHSRPTGVHLFSVLIIYSSKNIKTININNGLTTRY